MVHIFTAPDYGTYEFYSTSSDEGYHDTKAYLYNSEYKQLTWNDDSGEDNNFRIVHYLKRGEKVFLESRGYNSYKKINYYVNVTQID